jgi:polygalacturonase
MKYIVIPIFSVLSLLLFTSCGEKGYNANLKAGWREANRILERIIPPEFPEQEFPITDYGAVSDGRLSTGAFRKAIEACHEAGGGIVIVPADTFLTGAIHLLSNVNLHLEEGAVIRFSTDPQDYLPVVRTRSEGLELYNYSPLIYAYMQENIAITGKGVLDGQASKENWWIWRGREQFGWKEGMPSGHDPESFPRLFEMSEKGVPVEERIFGEGAYLRPSFVQPFQCKNILIEDVTLINPPMWMLHPVLSENLTIRGVKFYSQDAPNGDGCDPESCRDVLIEDCVFNTGDDCIAIKSGRNRQGYESGIPTENVIIRRCIMKDGHGGVTLGSELSGGIRNVYAYDCDMSSPKLARAIRMKSNHYRGGIVENIFIRDIRVGEVSQTAFLINQNYAEKSDVIYGPKKHTAFRNIYVEKLSCTKSDYAIQIIGNEEQFVENVNFMNCRFENVEKENVLEFVREIQFNNVEINGVFEEAHPVNESL